MSDPLDDIAAELGRLRPRGTSPRLNRRVEQELSTLEPVDFRPAPVRSGLRWTVLGLAASVMVVVAIGLIRRAGVPGGNGGGGEVAARTVAAPRMIEAPRTGPGEPLPATAGAAPVLRRVSRENYLLDAEDDGLILTSTTTPWRRVRWQYVAASEWRDERERMTFRVLIPREETMLIPVNIQ